jgi:uncharacterized OsmC-like protein
VRQWLGSIAFTLYLFVSVPIYGTLVLLTAPLPRRATYASAVAQNRNIQLRSVKATLEAGMDIQGILGIDSDVRNGFDGIKVHYDIDADASSDDIASLVAQSQRRSAVFDILTNPTDVTVTVG